MDNVASGQDNPYSDKVPASENDRSIAFILTIGKFKLFSGGDLTGSPIGEESKSFTIRKFGPAGEVYTNVESFLAHRWQSDNFDAHVSVYRANHHGSGHSSNGDLAQALKPEVVIYSSGPDNTYGHPDPDVVQEFCDMHAHAYITSGIDSSKYPHGFPSNCGKVVDGDIDITVTRDGSTFSVDGDSYSP
jgi:hypothetical protein